MALNLAPFGRWALRDKAEQGRLALRYAEWQRADVPCKLKAIDTCFS
jgi:hypothetical protein